MSTFFSSPPQFLLHTFLRNALFPNCISHGVDFKSLEAGYEHSPWPRYQELEREPGTRTLREVKEIDLWDFKTMVRKHLDESNDAFIREDSFPHIKLSCHGFADFEQAELDYFADIDDEDKFRKVMLENLLNTACECTRIFINLPRAAPFSQALRFERADEDKLDMTHKAKWDILVMSQSTYGSIPVTVICAPPWILSRKDLEEFAKPRTINDHELDKIVSSTSDNTITNTLWAVVHDVCHKRRHFFIITNYLYWSFGQFSPDWTTVALTSPMEANLMDVITGHTMLSKLPYGCTVIESLVYWIQVARGAAAGI